MRRSTALCLALLGLALLAELLLPDVLTFDTAGHSAYPNGRALADDVADVMLRLANLAPSDCVDGNDVPFQSGFPYLAPAR